MNEDARNVSVTDILRVLQRLIKVGRIIITDIATSL